MKQSKATPAPAPVTPPAATAPDDFKDRYGHTFAQLLAVQERQLNWWKQLLQPAHFTALEKFCQRTNKLAALVNDAPAPWPHGCHNVARGVELAHFMQTRAKFLLDEDDGDAEDDWKLTGIPPRSAAQKASASD